MKKPLGVTLLGVFLVLCTCIPAATTITLLFPGSLVDCIWDFKRGEYEQMLPYRFWAGTGFLVLGIVMAVAAYGWFRSRYWAWILVQCIFVVNGGADTGRILHGDPVGGLVGVVIVLVLIMYIRSKRVRLVF